jgi:hypothetical protein
LEQTTKITLHCAGWLCDPELVTENLLTEMFAWGHTRAKAIGLAQKSTLTVFANGFSQAAFSHQIPNVSGYVPLEPHREEHNVYSKKEESPDL